MYEIKENIYCFQYMFFYIFVIYSLIYILILFKNLPPKEDVNFLIKAMDYWKKKPIWKIVALRADSIEEPKDMVKYSFGKWPGTVKVCNCSTNYQEYYIKGVCSDKNLSNNCVNVKEEKEVNFYFYLFKYYVTYYNSDYLTLYSRIDDTKSKCKSGFKKCGLLDSSYHHPFCVKEEEDCVANNFYFVNKGDKIILYFGFNETYINTNKIINNIFIKDTRGCILNEDFIFDEYLLFQNKSDKLVKCDSKNTSSIYRKIPNSAQNKYSIYYSNGIYKNIGKIPGEYYLYNSVNLYSMSYFALNDSFSEYYYSDAFILKYFKFMNFLIFIFLKVGIQLGYFIFIQRTSDSKKYIKYNIVWLIIFLVNIILIWKFNNSLYRTSYFFTFESDDNNFNGIMKKIKSIDVFLVFLILLVHALKLIYIYTQKEQTKYSEFINEDK